MKTTRRNFLSSSTLAFGGASIISFPSCNSTETTGCSQADYTKLDEALKKPVLKRELFPDPVMIESLELLRDRNSCLYRVRSSDGAEGISVGHPFIEEVSYHLVPTVLKQSFVG